MRLLLLTGSQIEIGREGSGTKCVWQQTQEDDFDLTTRQ